MAIDDEYIAGYDKGWIEGWESRDREIVHCKNCKKCTEMRVHKTHWCNGPKKGPTKTNGFCDEGERA